MERKESLVFFRDDQVFIVKSDGTIGTTNKSGNLYWNNTDTYKSFGSASDLWGEVWTAEDINDIDFGVVFAGKETNPEKLSANTTYVDHIRITVYYTLIGPFPTFFRT